MNKFVFLIIGLLTSLLFPPYFLFPLGFIIFPFLCYYLDNSINKFKKIELFYLIFCFGFGFFLNFLLWIQNPFFVYEETENYFFISILLIVLLSLILSFTFVFFLSLNKIIPIFFALPLVFIVAEFVISIFIYGFPWITFSLIISSNEFFSFSLKHFGTFITSYIIIQIFCIPYIFFYKKNPLRSIKFFLLIISPLILIINFNLIFKEKNNEIENKIKVDILQLNLKPYLDKAYSITILNSIIDYISKSESNLIVFGENNYPHILKNLNFDNIQKILKHDQTVIIGATKIINKEYFNSLININDSNVSYFDKKILVPFGEFLPFRKYLKFLIPISGQSDFTEGKNKRLINIDDKFSYIPIICYEIVFYWKLINKINSNSNFVLNITNDTWFGNNLGPYQHFYLTKLRAAEFNKDLIRVSNNGISGLFNNNGKIIANTELNKKQTLSKTIYIGRNNNYYKVHLVLKVYFFVILILFFLINFIKYNDRSKI